MYDILQILDFIIVENLQTFFCCRRSYWQGMGFLYRFVSFRNNTPKEIGFKIIESDCDKITQGQTVHLSGKLLTKITWKSKIIFCKPYTYVDEMSEKGCSNIGSILMIFIKSSKIRPESQMRSSLNYLVVYWKTVRTICSR